MKATWGNVLISAFRSAVSPFRMRLAAVAATCLAFKFPLRAGAPENTGPAENASNAPWAHPAIAEISPTASTGAYQAAVAPSLGEFLDSAPTAGEDGSPEPTEPPVPPGLPSDFRIAALPVKTPFDATNLAERLEMAEVAQVLEKAALELRAGRPIEAEALLDAALERARQPRARLLLHHRRGALAFKRQDYEGAIHHMTQALALEPGRPTLVCNLAAALMTHGEVAEALDLLSSVPMSLVRNPKLLFSLHFNLACAHSLSGHVDDAVRHLAEAARYDAQATLASIGDIQLDAVRDDPRVRDLVRNLEHTAPPPSPSPPAAP